MIDLATARRLLAETLPSYQATSVEDFNLGFGYIFYAVARAMRPESVVVIGSKAGFSPLCFALGMAANAGVGIHKAECYHTILRGPQSGRLWFVDPSYAADRGDKDHWYGIGTWDDPGRTASLWESFGVGHVVQHYKMKSDDFLRRSDCPKNIDIVYIDGDHSYSGVVHDITQYAPRLSPQGIIIAHDVDPRLKDEFPDVGGYEAIESLPKTQYEVFRLPVYPGLAFIRPR